MRHPIRLALLALSAIFVVVETTALVLTCLGGPSATYHGPGIVLSPPIPSIAPVNPSPIPAKQSQKSALHLVHRVLHVLG